MSGEDAAKPGHHSINYIELPMTDKAATIAFYRALFGWSFEDWGPEYISFSGAGVDGGFSADTMPSPAGHGVLMVLYSHDLPASFDAVRDAGGTITKPIFGFPGGRRFQFTDPNGNELAIWSL